MRYLLVATALVLAPTAAYAADAEVIVREGVYKLPVSGPSGKILAYDDIGERRNGGTAAVTGTAPRNGNGSLQINGDRTRYVVGNIYRQTDPVYRTPGASSQALFKFSDLTSLTFDWRVDVSSSGFPHATPAVRAHIIDGNVRAEMIWEGVYNGGKSGVVPALGVWNSAPSDTTFYMNIREGGTGFLANAGLNYGLVGDNDPITGQPRGVLTLNGGQQDRQIGDWQSLFSADAYVTGLSFGSGGGFGNDFRAFVDNVSVRSPNGNDFVINFEAVPEPATWAMMISGFGFVGAAMRRRAKASDVRFA